MARRQVTPMEHLAMLIFLYLSIQAGALLGAFIAVTTK